MIIVVIVLFEIYLRRTLGAIVKEAKHAKSIVVYTDSLISTRGSAAALLLFLAERVLSSRWAPA